MTDPYITIPVYAHDLVFCFMGLCRERVDVIRNHAASLATRPDSVMTPVDRDNARACVSHINLILETLRDMERDLSERGDDQGMLDAIRSSIDCVVAARNAARSLVEDRYRDARGSS